MNHDCNNNASLLTDCLLTQPIDCNAKEMPSPTALRNKIILKVSEFVV